MNWEYFTHEELACRGTGECIMDEKFMNKLIKIREELDRPMMLSSAYRHPAHNSAINGAKDSPHVYGRAVDILCMGNIAYKKVMTVSKTKVFVEQPRLHQVC